MADGSTQAYSRIYSCKWISFAGLSLEVVTIVRSWSLAREHQKRNLGIPSASLLCTFTLPVFTITCFNMGPQVLPAVANIASEEKTAYKFEWPDYRMK